MALLWAVPAGAKATPPEIETYLKTPSPASVQPNPGEVSAYRESFGVSKNVATERLKLQTRGAAAHIGEALEEKLGESYGGLWFDNEAGEYVVALASPGSARGADRSAVAAVLSTAALSGGDYRTTVVDDSWSDLLNAGDRLAEELKSLIEHRKARVSIEPSTNSVTVGVRKGAGASALAEIAGLAKGAGVDVEVKTGEQKPFEKKLATCQDGGVWKKTCSQPMRGGVGIRDAGHGTARGHFCTSAFRARGKSDGKHYFLTAGHCVKELDEYEEEKWEDVVWDWESWDPVTWTGQSIGTLTEWHWPYHDWAKIDVTDTWADASPWNSVAYWNRGENGGIAEEEYFIYGEAEGQVGAQACHSGIATGTTCGHITELEKAFNPNDPYEEGGKEGTIVDAWEVQNTKEGDDLCLEGGDSGGSVFANHYALGIVSYGTHWYCDPESSMNFVKIEEATEDLNVSLTPAANAPAVATDAVTGYPAPHQATARGYLYGGGIPANYHFDYGVSNGIGQPFAPYESSSSLAAVGEAIEYKTGTLTGLKGGTTYHFRAVVQNSAETAKGISKTFTTPLWKPLVTPEGGSEVGVSEETGHGRLNAQVNPQGSSTTYRFEWGKASEGFPNSVPLPDANIGSGTSDIAVSQEITGLKGLTEYHWRVVASNEDGTTTSATQSFTTPDWRPVVTSEKQTGVKVLEEQGQATLHGKVNPKGFATDYRFEWGTEAEYEAEEYGHSVPVPDGEAGSGEEDVSVEATIKPIKGQSTYHFRLVAENAEGERIGDDKSFTTPDWRPSVGHEAGIGVGREETTLSARINPQGFSTHYHFKWGSQEEYEEGEYNNVLPVPDAELTAGNSPVEVAEELSGLEQRTRYHFRVVAENVEGVRTSGDESFTTSTSGFRAAKIEQYPLTLHGSPVSEFTLGLSGVVVFCEGPSFEAEMEAETDLIVTDSTEFPSCTWGSTPIDLETNGCRFEFDPGAEDTEGHFGGEMNIGPPGCGPITLTIANCPISIPAQIGPRASFENKGEGATRELLVDLNATGLRYSQESGGFCVPGEKADGIYAGEWQVEAEDSGGGDAGIYTTPLFEVGPTLTALDATGVVATQATVHGTIDTMGLPAYYAFEYGTTTEYGSYSKSGQISGEGTQPVEVERTLKDLEPLTTYHYRLLSVSSNGASYGEDQTFTTQAAQPPRFEAESYPATVEGELGSEEGFDVLSMGGGEVITTCESAGYDGAVDAPLYPNSTLPLQAEFGECATLEEEDTTVVMNSCRYVLHLTNAGPPYAGATEIACEEEGDKIEIKVSGICTIKVPAQSPVGSDEYENQGAGSGRTLEGTLLAEEVTFTKSGLFCFVLPGGEGGFGGEISLGAKDGEGAVGFYVGGEGQETTGVYLSGEESEEESLQPRFEAETYPAALAFEQDPADPFTIFETEAGPVSCDAVELDAASELPAAGAGLAFGIEAEGCGLLEDEDTTVVMNSCHYALSVANSGPPYTGSTGVACDEEGDAIEFVIPGICTMKVGPQMPAAATSYENAGSGANREIRVDSAAEGLSYERSGPACFAIGTGEDGSLGGGFRIFGLG